MDMSVGIEIIVVIGLGLLGLFILFIRKRSKRACPHCGSTNLVEINSETLGSRTIEFPNGYSGTGDVRLQLDLEKTYRCHQCHQIAKFAFRKTN